MSDEQIQILLKELEDTRKENRLANTGIKNEISELKKELVKDIDSVKKHYVRKEEYKVVRSLVFGFVALILTAFTTAIVALVIG